MNKAKKDLWQCIGLLIMFVLVVSVVIFTTPHTTVKGGWVITNDKTLHEQTINVTAKYLTTYYSEVGPHGVNYMVKFDDNKSIECEHKWIWDQLVLGSNTVWISGKRWNKPELIQAIKTPVIKGVQRL